MLLLRFCCCSPPALPSCPSLPPLAHMAWSPSVAASAVELRGFAWVVCLAQDLLHDHGRGNTSSSRLRGRLSQPHSSMSCLIMAGVILPVASFFHCSHSELDFSMDQR